MKRLLRITIALGLLGAALPAAPAQAGEYTVWSCRGPAGEPLPAAGWTAFGDVEGGDTCASGGALTARVDDDRHGWPHEHGGHAITAPAGARIAGYRIWRSARVGEHDRGWGHSGGFATLLEDGQAVGGCFAADGCHAVGDPANPLAPANLVERSRLGLRSLAIAVGCETGHGCDDDGAELRLYRAALAITDDVAPVAAGAASVGNGAVTVPAHDDGGGLRAAEARIDGRVVATAAAPGCAEPYTRARPCAADATFALAFDTTGLAAGAHALEVVVTDVAGNAATLHASTITIAGQVAGARAAAAHRLRLERRRFTTGERGAVAGRALRADGSAAPGATVLVERRWYGDRGGAWRRIGTLTADARGRFAVALPEEPQQLRFRLAPPARARATTVDVISRVTLRARMRPRTLDNGEVVVVRGRLAGAGRAARGKQVEVQAIVHGRWQTVGRAKARADGAFRWRYRFKRTLRESLYSFRVRVADDSRRWPWPTVTTRRMRVHVLP